MHEVFVSTELTILVSNSCGNDVVMHVNLLHNSAHHIQTFFVLDDVIKLRLGCSNLLLSSPNRLILFSVVLFTVCCEWPCE